MWKLGGTGLAPFSPLHLWNQKEKWLTCRPVNLGYRITNTCTRVNEVQSSNIRSTFFTRHIQIHTAGIKHLVMATWKLKVLAKNWIQVNCSHFKGFKIKTTMTQNVVENHIHHVQVEMPIYGIMYHTTPLKMRGEWLPRRVFISTICTCLRKIYQKIIWDIRCPKFLLQNDAFHMFIREVTVMAYRTDIGAQNPRTHSQKLQQGSSSFIQLSEKKRH